MKALQSQQLWWLPSKQWSSYRMAKPKSAESPYNGNTSVTSKGQWWKLELCDTSAKSKAKWWNFELLTESLVWYPGELFASENFCIISSNSVKILSWAELRRVKYFWCENMFCAASKNTFGWTDIEQEKLRVNAV